MPNPTEPNVQLLCKLGSIIVHADEATELGGHTFHAYPVDTYSTFL